MPDPLFIHPPEEAEARAPDASHVMVQRRLDRLLAFSGQSIDDVVNCDVSKRLVAGYFKLERSLARRTALLELERQWNPLGRRC